MINFAAICPHPPILLPSVSSKDDRDKVKKTLASLKILSQKIKEARPELIVISSPHSDWGFDVPLHFLAPDFKGGIKKYLTNSQSPDFYFQKGKNLYQSEIKSSKSKVALIASGDLSHRLKEDGPYGFHSDGLRFDNKLIELLKKKDIESVLKLDDLYPKAAECGLGSISFLLGILSAANINWQLEVLSYEGPFAVGYLVADFLIK